MFRPFKQFFRLGIPAVLLGLLSCKNDEEVYSPEPTLHFENIEFYEGDRYSREDSLVVGFTLTDGDEDLGLDNSPQYLEFPYQVGNYYQKSDARPVPSDMLKRHEVNWESLVTYDEWLHGPYDTLAGTECDREYFPIGEGKHVELFRTMNENFWNLFIDFQYENPDGSFTTFDFYSKYCVTFNDRIPPLNSFPKNKKITIGGFQIEMKSPKKSHIRYSILSGLSRTDLSSKKLKVRIHVQDRALHMSNVIETPPFFFGRDLAAPLSI